MMRTVQVEGGFQPTVTVDLVDNAGPDGLADSVFRLALVPEGAADPPAVGSDDWRTPTVAVSGAEATVVVALDDSPELGHYHLAVDVLVEGRHEAVWVMDPDRPTRRALLYLA